MTAEQHPPKRPASRSRWSSTSSTPARPYRQTLRLLGIPALAIAGVLIYKGLQERFVLPECNSERAKSTLGDLLKQLKLEPLRDEPIKTVSTSKDEVVCNAVLALPDGAEMNVDYSFFWQGTKANMKYSISRKTPQNSAIAPPLPGL